MISEQQFRLLSAHFEQDKKDYTEQIEKLKAMAENLEDSTDKAERLADEMAECAEIKELTTEIVNRLIEKIEVSEPQTINGEKVQNIRIFYKFVGEINEKSIYVSIILGVVNWPRKEPATGQRQGLQSFSICRS